MDDLDKRIEKIVKEYNVGNLDSDFIWGLCTTFMFTEFEYNWDDYWNIVNTRKYTFMPHYFKNSVDMSRFEKGFLRLLVLEDFKNYLRKKGIK